jgi:predicted ArsR family transcriptional regulator
MAEMKLKKKILETLSQNQELSKQELFDQLRIPISEMNLHVLRKLMDEEQVVQSAMGKFSIKRNG